MTGRLAAVAWLLLIIAGFLETGWAIGSRYAEGWTRLRPSLPAIALMAGSFFPPLISA